MKRMETYTLPRVERLILQGNGKCWVKVVGGNTYALPFVVATKPQLIYSEGFYYILHENVLYKLKQYFVQNMQTKKYIKIYEYSESMYGTWERNEKPTNSRRASHNECKVSFNSQTVAESPTTMEGIKNSSVDTAQRAGGGIVTKTDKMACDRSEINKSETYERDNEEIPIEEAEGKYRTGAMISSGGNIIKGFEAEIDTNIDQTQTGDPVQIFKGEFSRGKTSKISGDTDKTKEDKTQDSKEEVIQSKGRSMSFRPLQKAEKTIKREPFVEDICEIKGIETDKNLGGTGSTSEGNVSNISSSSVAATEIILGSQVPLTWEKVPTPSTETARTCLEMIGDARNTSVKTSDTMQKMSQQFKTIARKETRARHSGSQSSNILTGSFDPIVYIECKIEVVEDVLNSIKVTYGQQGIDSLISDLDQFAKVDTHEDRILVLCDIKDAENVKKCVRNHYNEVTKKRKTTEVNKYLIHGGSDNLMEWLKFAYGLTSWSKNLQLEEDKLYLTGTLQMKREVEKAVHSMNYWYQEKYILSSEEQQKADEVVAVVKSDLPTIFIKQANETMIVLSDNRDNFERANFKVKVALGRIKITARRRRRDPLPYGESYSGQFKDDKMDASPKFSSSGFQNNQPTADLTPKSCCTKEGLTVKTYIGNITSLSVDCIVNAANGLLSHGGGVALAISKAAGRDFDQEGEAYIKKHGPISVTQCCVTSAGRLHYKRVIHAVGPQWSDYKDKDKCINDLKETIFNCLTAADNYKMSSIAIPPLSSGIFGVPKDLCAQMYAKGVIEYSKTYGLQSVKEIHFVDTVYEMCQLTQSAFDKELQCS